MFQVGSVWVNTGFCSICRPSSSYICSVSSYLPIYIGKSLRLEWDFMALWFLNPDPVLQAFVFFTVTGRRSATYSAADSSMQVLSGCPANVSSFLVPWMVPSPPGWLSMFETHSIAASWILRVCHFNPLPLSWVIVLYFPSARSDSSLLLMWWDTHSAQRCIEYHWVLGTQLDTTWQRHFVYHSEIYSLVGQSIACLSGTWQEIGN